MRRWGYKGNCGCAARSPQFPSSELAERWLIAHVACHHPERLERVRERALAGGFSGHSVFVDPDRIPTPST